MQQMVVGSAVNVSQIGETLIWKVLLHKGKQAVLPVTVVTPVHSESHQELLMQGYGVIQEALGYGNIVAGIHGYQMVLDKQG